MIMTKEQWLECVGPGWHKIVEPLIDKAWEMGITIDQIKEKYGGLRFYFSGGLKITGKMFDKFMKLVDEAEARSYLICERCGKDGKLRQDLDWILTLCDEHYLEEKK